MIFARDKSQMCNNLLQFAHVYAWAREHNRDVMSMRFSYKYPFFRISKSKYASFPMYLMAKWGAALKILPTASFKHADCDTAALERKMLAHKHIVVSGWNVRFYDLFLKYRQEICQLFEINAKHTVPVKEKMSKAEVGAVEPLRLGLHIRRGDYAEWKNGIYFYDDETYAAYVRQFASLFPKRDIHVYIATNDNTVSEERFQRMVDVSCKQTRVHFFSGTGIEDLFMLSECDYIIGPPSTYSLVAAMYKNLPLCRMDTVEAENMQKTDFKDFDFWFRRIV